jgi:hypothetical protein
LFLTFVVDQLTLNLKQKMDYFFGGLVVGLIIGMITMMATVTAPNTAYTKGVTDCRSGKVSYTVTVGPEGVDTAYTYNPK